MRIACILELAESDKDGGRKIATLQLVERLRKRGVEVDILSFGNGLPHVLPRFLRETPVLRAVTAFPLAGRKALASLEGEYDLFYLTSTTTASLYRPRTPSLLYCHGVIAHKWEKFDLSFPYTIVFNRFLRSLVTWFEKRCVENLDAVLAVHADTMDFITRGLKAKAARSFILPNGVDTDLFHPGEGGEGVVFVGRATASKGFDTLLRAAPTIGAPIKAVVYKINRDLMREAQELGVRVVTGVPHHLMPEHYRGASLFVLPSLDEELPLTTLEAMACGLPVVVSRAAGAGMVGEGENGFTVADRDARGLAEAVNRLLHDAELRRRMGERNRALAVECYSWERVAERFLAICDELAGEAKR